MDLRFEFLCFHVSWFWRNIFRFFNSVSLSILFFFFILVKKYRPNFNLCLEFTGSLGTCAFLQGKSSLFLAMVFFCYLQGKSCLFLAMVFILCGFKDWISLFLYCLITQLRNGSRLTFSYISFSLFTFPGAPYRTFLPWLPRLPCYFYLVIEQQHWFWRKFL